MTEKIRVGDTVRTETGRVGVITRTHFSIGSGAPTTYTLDQDPAYTVDGLETINQWTEDQLELVSYGKHGYQKSSNYNPSPRGLCSRCGIKKSAHQPEPEWRWA